MGQGTSGRLGGRTMGRSGDAVFDLHRTRGGDEEHDFAVWPQNRWLRFGDLGLKITATVFGLGLKTKERGGLSVCALKLTGG